MREVEPKRSREIDAYVVANHKSPSPSHTLYYAVLAPLPPPPLDCHGSLLSTVSRDGPTLESGRCRAYSFSLALSLEIKVSTTGIFF